MHGNLQQRPCVPLPDAGDGGVDRTFTFMGGTLAPIWYSLTSPQRWVRYSVDSYLRRPPPVDVDGMNQADHLVMVIQASRKHHGVVQRSANVGEVGSCWNVAPL